MVSASIEIKKITALGKRGNQNQVVRCCVNTISLKFSEPAKRITGKIVRPIDTSYEIICAAERNDPKKAYFELLAQPAMMIP